MLRAIFNSVNFSRNFTTCRSTQINNERKKEYEKNDELV